MLNIACYRRGTGEYTDHNSTGELRVSSRPPMLLNTATMVVMRGLNNTRLAAGT
jgi:hypothetical protein